MEIITLNEKDYLDYHLFSASQSKQVKRKKWASWIIIFLSFVMMGIYYYSSHQNVHALLSVLLAACTAAFLPAYTERWYRKNYEQFIRANYAKNFGRLFKIDITDYYIFMNDDTGESKTKVSEIDRIDETCEYYFISMKNCNTIIVPKIYLHGETFSKQLESVAKNIGVGITKRLDWKT